MKYIDAERLQAFKEALADTIVSAQGLPTYEDCKERAEVETDALLATLFPLQQEQPEVYLEKEISRWMVEECGPSDFNPYADHWCADDVVATARHFAEWGRKQVLQEIYDGKVKPVDKITAAWFDDEQNT